MLPIGRATFEFEEFLAACEYDLGCSPDTVSFYRKKVTRFITWAQQEKAEALDAQTVRTRKGVNVTITGEFEDREHDRLEIRDGHGASLYPAPSCSSSLLSRGAAVLC